MHVKSTGILSAYPDTHVKLRASRLHAPLIERALELPFDIYEGIYLNPELQIFSFVAFYDSILAAGYMQCPVTYPVATCQLLHKSMARCVQDVLLYFSTAGCSCSCACQGPDPRRLMQGKSSRDLLCQPDLASHTLGLLEQSQDPATQPEPRTLCRSRARGAQHPCL